MGGSRRPRCSRCRSPTAIPFQFGFVNFALSMALALNAVRAVAAARRGSAGSGCARSIFVPLSCLLWLCHTFGWGVLGVLAFSAEMIRQHDMRRDSDRRELGAWLVQGVVPGRAALPAARAADGADDRRGAAGEHVGGQDRRLVQLARQDQLDDDGPARSLDGVRHRLGRGAVPDPVQGVRDPTIEYSRNLGLSALFLLAVFIAAAADRVRIGLCRHAAGAVHARRSR